MPERHTFFNVSIADIKLVNFFWVNRMFTLISHPYNTKAYCESISLFLYHSNRLNKKTAMTKSIFQFKKKKKSTKVKLLQVLSQPNLSYMFQSFASSIVALMLYDKHNIAIKAFLLIVQLLAHNLNGRLQNSDHKKNPAPRKSLNSFSFWLQLILF